MKIPLKPYATPVRQRLYHLNMRYKERLKVELDRMLDDGIIEPVQELEWISPVVVQNKKTGEVRIYVNLRKLNDVCMHDPFPTPFTNEVLKGVGGQEIYSFMDGFFSYHQIKIMKEYHHKTTFVIEWGCFQYTVMPFGMNNAPAIFSIIVITRFKHFIQNFLVVYMDNWTIYGLIRDHLENMRRMLERYRQHQ